MSATNGTVATDGDVKSLSLERKYIRLLEKRIATLEALVEAENKTKGKELKEIAFGEENSEDDDDDESKNARKEKTKDDKDGVSSDKKGTDEPASRVRSLIRRWDKRKYRYVDDAAEIKSDDANADTAYAFTIRKFLDPEKNKFSYSEVDIEASGLRALLAEQLKHYPGHLWDSDPVNISENFAPIVHNWDKLQEEANKTKHKSPEEEQARKDLKELLNIISTGSGNAKLDQYFKTRESHMANRTITYDTIWTLFPPGCLVYSAPFLKEPQVFIVGSKPLEFPIVHGRREIPWSLVCYSYDWTGSKFERKAYEFQFERFAGSKAINTLPCYPLEYYGGENGEEDRETIRAKLIKRGRKFRELCIAGKGKQMFNYKGTVLSRGVGITTIASSTQPQATPDDYYDEERSIFSSSVGESKKPTVVKPTSHSVKGTIMIDFESWFQYADTVAPLGTMQPYSGDEECGCQTCKSNPKLKNLLKYDYDGWTAKSGEFEDDQYMICPPRVLGYVMDRKMWAQLNVNEVRPVDLAGTEDTFENKLELDEDIRELLKGLVVHHEGGKSKDKSGKLRGIEDVVEGKGKGLVILLHGPPGVGKTLTAESVALRAGKPLFSVGVSDVGVNAQKVESNLARMFDLASQWEAVLLIDEADVFLDSRETGDSPLDKSALVSVLLRVLEYYEGILILTTNRIRTFDVAVQSRIHLAVKYEDLTKEQTKKIYFNFLNQLRERKCIDDWDDVQKWVNKDSFQYRFNGRQIRNVVSSAMGIARSEEGLLTRQILDRMARKTLEFMNDTRDQMAVYKSGLKQG